MFRNMLLLALVPAVLASVPNASADDLTSVDDIIAKMIESLGGRKAMDNIKTLRVDGKMVMGDGPMEAPLHFEYKLPANFRMEFTFQGMTGIQAYDGETGWLLMPFMGKTDPEKMPPEQVKQIADQADLHGPLVDYKKKGHKVELIGKEEDEGSEVYKLKVTKKNGDVETHFLDAEYLIPLKTKSMFDFQGTKMEVEVAFGDYKEVEGLMIAHSIETRSDIMNQTFTFEKVEVNVDLPDERFKMPKVEKKAEEAEVKSNDDKPAEKKP